jgi:peptidoglycan/xylan/chitin deacetylase (PgdA/CDA1 family)
MMVERYEDLLQYVSWKRKFGIWQTLRFWFKKTIFQMKSLAKVFLASMVYHSGLLEAFLHIKRILRLGRVKILCLHDVSDSREHRKHFSIFVTSDSFSKLLDFLKRNYQVISLEKAVSLLKTNQPLTQDVFALTFDDCYRGWIQHVMPECLRRQIPCTCFIATGPLDGGPPPAYNTLIFLATNTWRKLADLSCWQLGVFLLDTPENILYFVEKVHKYLRAKGRRERIQFLDKLSEYLGVSLHSKKLRDTILTWDDVRKMDTNGVIIGAHSVSHCCLSSLGDTECFWEIFYNKKRLEQELGHKVNVFAYPYGGPDSYNRAVIEKVQKVGFTEAFTLINKNLQFRGFEIGRSCLSSPMFCDHNWRFKRSLLAVKLSGLDTILFRRRPG